MTEFMELKILRDLSIDTKNERFVVNSELSGYDMDGYVKKYCSKKTSDIDYLIGDTYCTVDALIDSTCNNSGVNCNLISFVEFKAGELHYDQIRRKALESLCIYAYWKGIDRLIDLPEHMQFILVYNGQSECNYKMRARSICQKLSSNKLISSFYQQRIHCLSGTEFDDKFATIS